MLHAVATPIGNLGDLSPRALEAFKSASLVACEDTRRTWQLLSAFGVPRPEMVSYRQGREERAEGAIIEAARAGREVVLCSDGGYPSVSDPGYRLLRRCAAEGVPFDQYCRLLDGSDVLLDQLYSYTPSMNTLLAMSKGIVCVGGGEPENYEIIGETELRQRLPSPGATRTTPGAAARAETPERRVRPPSSRLPEGSPSVRTTLPIPLTKH